MNKRNKSIFIFNKQTKEKYELLNTTIALCTMGKLENLYINEFISYYIKLGVDHIIIYDNNEPKTEKIKDVIKNNYANKVSIFETYKYNINHQSQAFTNCYQTFKQKYDWFIMVDIDEYLYIINDTLKHYLNDEIFKKCDFIKLHWVTPTDNNLLYYDKRPLFERFKGPFIKEKKIKSIIRGNISDLMYWVHSPSFSPKNNITCNNEGKRIIYKHLNFEEIEPINTKRAFIIHFRFKSTEEFIKKYKRGYSNWHGNLTNNILNSLVELYFSINEITIEKINYIERELKLNLSLYKYKLKILKK